jgi:hypothetical protein
MGLIDSYGSGIQLWWTIYSVCPLFPLTASTSLQYTSHCHLSYLQQMWTKGKSTELVADYIQGHYLIRIPHRNQRGSMSWFSHWCGCIDHFRRIGWRSNVRLFFLFFPPFSPFIVLHAHGTYTGVQANATRVLADRSPALFGMIQQAYPRVVQGIPQRH